MCLLLAAITVALVVLLRTRWKEMRPLRKCALLSLWVHVVLACLATMVRIFSGSPGLGPDEPIRVAVVTFEQAETTTPPEEDRLPEWERPKDPPLVAPELEPLPPAEIAEEEPEEQSDEPPIEPEPPAELHEPAEASSPDADPPQPTSDASGPDAATPKPEPETSKPELRTPNPEPSPSEPSPPAPQPPAPHQPPTTYADRFAENRAELVARRGGNERTERAVRSALAWLAAAQSEDGRWDAARHGAGRELVVLGHNRQGAGAHADTGVTGLALLAFLGSGHTHGHGSPYSAQIARGLDYLRRTQAPSGALYGDAQLFARTYCHSMATFAVCEAYALTADERIRPIAQAATAYSLNIQNPNTGGWRYRPGDAGDTSQLGWQLMALKSAQLSGVDVPPVTWTRIERFLRRVRRGADGGLASYRPEGPASRSMTAEALFCRQLLASPTGSPAEVAALDEAARSIATQPPSTGQMNLYYWYYATLALHQSQNQTPAARKAWQEWNRSLVDTLLATQQSDGSWPYTTVWGGYGGRVYTTSLAALCLEVYYRYTPEEQPAGVAARDGWRSVQVK